MSIVAVGANIILNAALWVGIAALVIVLCFGGMHDPRNPRI